MAFAGASSISGRFFKSAILPPTDFMVASILGGFRLTWTDSITLGSVVEIYRSIDEADYVLLTTVAYGIETYDDTDITGTETEVAYRIRAMISESVVAPSLVSIKVENATPTKVLFTFDNALDEASGTDSSAFAVLGKTISGIAISGATVEATVTVHFYWGDTATGAYTKPVSNPLKGDTGGEVATFGATSITNNVAVATETSTLITASRYTNAPTDALKALINKTIVDLKADGIFSKADLMYVHAPHESLFALQNWAKNAHNGILSATPPSFTAKAGFKGNGSSSYIDLNYVPSTDASQFSRLDCSIVHMATILGTTTARNPFGAQRTTAPAKALYLIDYTAGAVERMYLNSATYNGNVNRAANEFLGYTRISGSVRGFINGSVIGADAASTAQADPLVDRSIYALANNSEAGVGGWWNGEVSFFWLGKGLSDSEMATLYTRMAYFYSNVGATF